MHNHCHAIFKKRSSTCPACNADWSGANEKMLFSVGEDAARDGNEQRQTRAIDEGEAEEDGDGVEADDDGEPAQSQLSSTQPSQPARKNAKRGTRRVQVDEDDDDESMAVEDDSSPAPTQRTRSRRK
jgi:hypothetical protein